MLKKIRIISVKSTENYLKTVKTLFGLVIFDFQYGLKTQRINVNDILLEL